MENDISQRLITRVNRLLNLDTPFFKIMYDSGTWKKIERVKFKHNFLLQLGNAKDAIQYEYARNK